MSNSKYSSTEIVVCKSLWTLVSLKDKSYKKKLYSYNILLMDTQYKNVDCYINNVKYWQSSKWVELFMLELVSKEEKKKIKEYHYKNHQKIAGEE